MSEVIQDVRRGFTSASNAAADAACPGRHNAQRGIPEPEKSEDANTGTRIHMALADQLDLRKLSLDERETFDACRDIEKRTVSAYFGEVEHSQKEPLKVWRHQRLWAKVPPTGVEHSGEADVMYRRGNKVLIADYKCLTGDVADSPKNLQLRDLAVLAFGAFVTIEEVATLIIQPLVTHTPEVCVYRKPDLDKAMAAMYQRVLASNIPQAPRFAGETQCQFCLAAKAGTCVEYQRWAGQMAPPQILTVLEIPMATWTPEQRAVCAGALGPAMDFLEQMKAFFKDGLAKDPSFLPGWKLQPGNKRETITDPQQCYTRFAALGGSLEQFMGTIAVGKSKLKDAVNVVTGARGQALEKAIKTLTDGITETGQNAPSLRKIE